MSRGWKWVLGIGAAAFALKLLNDSHRYRAALRDASMTANPTNNVGGNLLPKPVTKDAIATDGPANGDGNALADTNPYAGYGEGYFA